MHTYVGAVSKYTIDGKNVIIRYTSINEQGHVSGTHDARMCAKSAKANGDPFS